MTRRIGCIVPAPNVRAEEDFVALAPPGVAVHFNRMDVDLATPLADILDTGGPDDAELRVDELQKHSPADVVHLEHRPAPSGPVHIHQHRFRAELRVTGNHDLAAAAMLQLVGVVLGFHLKHDADRQVIQQHAPLDLRLADVVVDLVTEVGVRTGGALPSRFGSEAECLGPCVEMSVEPQAPFLETVP